MGGGQRPNFCQTQDVVQWYIELWCSPDVLLVMIFEPSCSVSDLWVWLFSLFTLIYESLDFSVTPLVKWNAVSQRGGRIVKMCQIYLINISNNYSNKLKHLFIRLFIYLLMRLHYFINTSSQSIHLVDMSLWMGQFKFNFTGKCPYNIGGHVFIFKVMLHLLQMFTNNFSALRVY